MMKTWGWWVCVIKQATNDLLPLSEVYSFAVEGVDWFKLSLSQCVDFFQLCVCDKERGSVWAEKVEIKEAG